MSAAVAVVPTSGTAKDTVVRVDVTGLASNDVNAYDSTPDPGALTEPEIRYYIDFTLSGAQMLKSHQFSPSQAGKHSWYSIVTPAAGTYTIAVKKVSDDSSVTTTTFVAS